MIEQVLSFWFERHGPEQWWAKDPAFDEAIRTEFGALHASAALGELHDWRDGPDGRLAEIIVLDQFSRNLYREDPQSLRLRRHGAGLGAGGGTHRRRPSGPAGAPEVLLHALRAQRIVHASTRLP